MLDYKKLVSQTRDLSLLLVEDYEPLRNDMTEILEDFFKTVTVAADGRKALELYKEYHAAYNKGFDLVISDIQMPVMNGVELSEALREIDADQKIIILSAHTDSHYLLRLINLGIAQFITKPVQHEKLLDTLYDVSRKLVIKQVKFPDKHIIHLGENYIWDQEKLLLTKNGSDVELTRYELLLLQLFLCKAEQICTNADIMQDFYVNDIDISEKNIRNLVFNLRKKLPEGCIISLYGLGYKFTPLI